jgi:hypothetical protein
MKKVEHSSSYTVGDGVVHLIVTIGEGQFGSTLVTVGAKVFDQERTFDHDVGTGAQLRGQTISVFSVVNDTNTQTNLTSVAYELTGGPTPLKQTVSLTVDDERESADYIATFTLV